MEKQRTPEWLEKFKSSADVLELELPSVEFSPLDSLCRCVSRSIGCLCELFKLCSLSLLSIENRHLTDTLYVTWIIDFLWHRQHCKEISLVPSCLTTNCDQFHLPSFCLPFTFPTLFDVHNHHHWALKFGYHIKGIKVTSVYICQQDVSPNQ